MQYKGMNLCDFCFEPVAPGCMCGNCGLSHETYNAEAGLLMPGTNLMGKYIIGRVLGRGGFGATYLAYSSDRDEVVAIKEYYPTGISTRARGEQKISIVSDDKRTVFDKGATRFFEEAKTMARFNTNKNVVSVYEFFYANDTVYYSMEYLRGIDLKGYIRKRGGRITEAEAVTMMKGVCDALVAVHSTQTLHRDISPDNIYVCTNGDVKLIDFGAAKQVLSDSQQAYSVVVKKGFAPAEQYQSKGKQGVWTDIYAVGATVYYALTGQIPPDAMSRAENPEIEFDASLNLSPQFVAVVKKCLEPRIQDRYQSAIELLGALNALNVANAQLGGDPYVATVYNGVRTSLEGENVSFVDGRQSLYPGMSQYPNSQYPNSQYPNSQYPNSQYPNSQYPNSQFPVSQYPPHSGVRRENNAMIKGLIIGVASLIIVVCVVILIIYLVPDSSNNSTKVNTNQSQTQPGYMPPPPPPPPGGGYMPPPPPGGMPPPPPPGYMPPAGQ